MLTPRQIARNAKQVRYSGGRPCAKGHTGERYTATMKCCQCEYERMRRRVAKNRKSENHNGCVC